MTLRCKPGDLCVIVGATGPNRNRFVTVLPGHPHRVNGYDCWLVESPTKLAVPLPGGSNLAFVPDAWMRPIRDPGEDATDQTLTWLPVPTSEEVPA